MVLILIWLQFVDIGEVLTGLKKVEIIKLLPVFFLMFLSVGLRGIRLKVFLARMGKLSTKDAIFLNGTSVMLNFFIPIRGGEIIKGFYISGNLHLPLAKSLIWIFLDRFVDFLALLVLSMLLLLIVPTSLGIKFTIVITAILSLSLGIIYLMIFKSNFARKMFQFLRHLLIINSIKIYFVRLTEFFLDSFTILKRSIKDWSVLISLTFFAYAVDAFIWYFTFLALNSPQDYLKMYLGQLLSALTYLIPAAPGYIGSAEASGLLIFTGVFGIDANLASSMVVLFHILTVLFIICFGITSVYFLKLDLGEILEKVFRKGS